MLVSRRRIVILVVVAIACALLGYLLVPNSAIELRPQFGDDESQPISNTHVGKTREQIVAQIGKPKTEWAGFFGLPPRDYAAQHPGAKTMYYEWKSGRFYASIKEVDGRWVCFQSHWVPKGWNID